jgi:DNA primase catalytic subunit
MNTATIREKLYDYIRIADEKKIKAIYWMLEDEIVERVSWWKDKAFTDELDKEFNAWKSGKEKSYSLKEASEGLEALRKKRKAK